MFIGDSFSECTYCRHFFIDDNYLFLAIYILFAGGISTILFTWNIPLKLLNADIIRVFFTGDTSAKLYWEANCSTWLIAHSP